MSIRQKRRYIARLRGTHSIPVPWGSHKEGHVLGKRIGPLDQKTVNKMLVSKRNKKVKVSLPKLAFLED